MVKIVKSVKIRMNSISSLSCGSIYQKDNQELPSKQQTLKHKPMASLNVILKDHNYFKVASESKNIERTLVASNQSLMYLIPTKNATSKSLLNTFKAQIVVSDKGQNLVLTPITDPNQIIKVIPETPQTQNFIQNDVSKRRATRYCGDFKPEDFNDLSKAKLYISVAKRQISKQKQKIKTINQENRRLLSKMKGNFISFNKKQLNEWKTKTTFINLESLENVCTLCLSQGDLVEFKDQGKKNFDLKRGFLEFVLDEVPEKACKQCCEEVHQMTLLIEKYRIAQKKFKQHEKQVEDAKFLQENVTETITENLQHGVLCEKCGNSVTDMTQHLQENPSCKPTYSCPKCSKEFPKLSLMKRHRSRHYNNRNFMCHICAKIFKFRANLNRHLKVHKLGKRFMCEYCAKSFTTNFTLQQHMNFHENLKPHQCKYCDMRFSYYGAKCHHEKRHERMIRRENAQKDETEPKAFICEICGRVFGKFRSLMLHKTSHNENQVFTCTICKRKFPARHILAKHYETHALNMNFKCHYCPKRFRTSLCLKKHEMIHTDERPYACGICEKKFRQPQHLGHHILSHTNEKPFQCEICSKGFTSKATLVVHVRIHTGETPFECHVCKKSFRDVAVRKRHVLTKHGQNEVERIPSVFEQDLNSVLL